MGKEDQDKSSDKESKEKTKEDYSRDYKVTLLALTAFGEKWTEEHEKMIFEVFKDALLERGIDINKVEKVVFSDTEKKITIIDSPLELYVYSHGNEFYTIEVDSDIDNDDINWFMVKSRVLEEIVKKTPKMIMLTIYIDTESLDYAKKFGIDVIYEYLIPSFDENSKS